MTSAMYDLQRIVFDRLKTDTNITALVAARIYDHVPARAGTEGKNIAPDFPYISFGASSATDDDAEGLIAGEFSLQIDIWSQHTGSKKEAYKIVDAVKKSLHHYDVDMGVNALADMRVVLRRVIDDPDGVTSHGIVQIEAMIEEND